MKHYAWRAYKATDPERLARVADLEERRKARAERAAAKAKRVAQKTRGIIEGPESSLLVSGLRDTDPYIFGEEDQVARESKFQTHLIERLGNMFPGCFISKMDSGYTQGVPDLLILWRKHWAMLEVKAEANATQQPNQDWYVSQLNRMSFAAFIYPENEEEVLRGLEQAFRPARATRVPVGE